MNERIKSVVSMALFVVLAGFCGLQQYAPGPVALAALRSRLKAGRARIGVPVTWKPMPADPLTPDVSARICLHMNNDHAEAVLSYARHYGGVEAPQSARMLQVLPEAMELEVDGSTVAVPFDHTLTDSEDAHRTLVAMLRSMPKG